MLVRMTQGHPNKRQWFSLSTRISSRHTRWAHFPKVSDAAATRQATNDKGFKYLAVGGCSWLFRQRQQRPNSDQTWVKSRADGAVAALYCAQLRHPLRRLTRTGRCRGCSLKFTTKGALQPHLHHTGSHNWFSWAARHYGDTAYHCFSDYVSPMLGCDCGPECRSNSL